MEEESMKHLRTDEQFCSSCGAIIKKAAEICPKCGVRIKLQEEYRKSKVVAVILAFFFGFLSWLYTWKADKIKFIGVLVVSFLLGILAGAITGGMEYEESFVISIYLIWGLAWVIYSVTWLWAVILALVRPQSFYKYY